MGGIDYASLPTYRGALADAVGFSDSDLEANRARRISQAQRASLLRDDRNRIGFVGLALVAAAASFAIDLSFGLTNIKSLKASALTVFFVIAAAFGFISAQKLWSDIRSGVVTSVEGFVSSDVKQSGSTQQCYWAVGERRFSVSGGMYTVLEPGRYRLYVLPRSQKIVSIEPLTDPGLT